MEQKSSVILMIRPVLFGFNAQTAASNSFQQTETELISEQIQQKALAEFNAFATLLKAKDVEVIVFDDTEIPHTPDSIFPNNWISFHENKIVLYPMLAENRRLERRTDIIAYFSHPGTELIDLSENEQNSIFLEGTGSIVVDYKNKIAYANRSPRTDLSLLETLCKKLNYSSVVFKAVDKNGAAIYHTNVLMCIGDGFAVLCNECIADKNEATLLLHSLKITGHEIIEISAAQMNSFAGNMYQLFTAQGKSLIVMSGQAHRSLTKLQVHQLEKYGELVFSDLDTIEKYGGGSARCMVCDVTGYG